MNLNFLRFGAAQPPPQWIPLRAGPLTLEFDPGRLALRYIRLGQHEVLRCIYAAVRDRNWGTVPPVCSDLAVSSEPDRFELSFTAHCRQGEIDFSWRGLLAGSVDGTIRFRFDGEARSSFLRARIGICVLHPLLECAGQPCTVEHMDGSLEASEFPRLIAPDQPFRNVRALTHRIASSLAAEVRFAGDVFETEDQRNWTDASFKTYSTPLDLPYPVRVESGTRILQEVHLTLRGQAPPGLLAGEHLTAATLSVVPEIHCSKSAIGLGMATHGHELTAREVERLRMLGLAHLRVDVRFAEPGWAERLRRAAADAKQLRVALHVALHLSDDVTLELDQLSGLIGDVRCPVGLWLILHVQDKIPPAEWVALAKATLAALDHRAPIAVGTDAYFAELNRNRLPAELEVLPCYSVNPQVHATDAASLVENLGGLADTVGTARQFSGQPAVISPVTLRPRLDPNATGDGAGGGEALPAEVDPRQLSLLGAAWTLGSLAQLAFPGPAHSITYYETTGWHGLMETEAGSSMPDHFPSIPGVVFPLFHVFADLAPFSRLVEVQSNAPLRAVGLGLQDDRLRWRLLVANLRAETQAVQVRLPPNLALARVRHLDETTAERAMREPEAFAAEPGEMMNAGDRLLKLQLRPYAVARLDLS